MMWINRAFLLEKEVLGTKLTSKQVTQKTSHISDAFRASLQVTKEPSALIGLASNGLLGLSTSGVDSDNLGDISMWDIQRSNDEYRAMAASRGEQVKGIVGALSAAMTAKAAWRSSYTSKDILLEPHRAELWLGLAKQVISKSPMQCHRHTDTASAHSAASKAVLILTSQLSEQSHASRPEKEVTEEYVLSDILSEALTLKAGTAPNVHDELKNMQQAVLTSPWNTLARQALC